MRPAAFTISLLLHTGVLCAVGAWRVNAPAGLRTSEGEVAPAVSFLGDSPAAPPLAEEARPIPPEPPMPEPRLATAVEAIVDPVVATTAEAIANTPAGLMSTQPALTPSSAEQATPRRGSRTLAHGAGAGRGSGVGAGFEPPRYRSCPTPPYPAAARAQRLEGTVLLLVLVDEAGRPTGVTLRRGSGSRLLDEAALRAVWSWRFIPARAEGRAIAASVEVPIRFRHRG